MPQHKSAAKRARQNETRRIANRLHKSRIRTLVKKLRGTTDREDAVSQLNSVKAYMDRLAGKGILKKNQAANYKSDLDKLVNTLA